MYGLQTDWGNNKSEGLKINCVMYFCTVLVCSCYSFYESSIYLFIFFIKNMFFQADPQISKWFSCWKNHLNRYSSDFQDNHLYGYCCVGRKVKGEKQFSFKCNINENYGQKLSIQMWCDGLMKSDVFISVWKLLPRSAVLHWSHNSKTRCHVSCIIFFQKFYHF